MTTRTGILLRGLIGLLLLAGILIMLSGEIEGMNRATAALDRIGFDAGKYRVSALSLIRFGAIVAALFVAARLVIGLIRRFVGGLPGIDATQRLLAEKIAGIAVVAAAFFVGIDVLGIDLTALAIFSGAFGLAIGFGLQKTVGNLIAGIILLMDRSVKPGDVIVVGESFGWVNKIGVRAVSVITRDGKEHLIPNENLMTQEVENWSFSDRNVRLHIPIRVAQDADLPLAQTLMVEAAKVTPQVLADPPPGVWLTGFDDGAALYDILAWVGDPERGVGSVHSDVLLRVWQSFRDNGVAIPFPQREVRVQGWPAVSSGSAAPSS